MQYNVFVNVINSTAIYKLKYINISLTDVDISQLSRFVALINREGEAKR